MIKEEKLVDEELRYLLGLLRAPNLGARTLGRLFESGLTPTSIFELPTRAMREKGLKANTVAYLQNPNWSVVENDCHWLEEKGNYLITLASSNYPLLLKEIYDPPAALFVKGDLEVLNTIQLGMVGSRNPTPDGRRLARNFAGQLAALGLTITSGLATGIDSCSH